MNGDFPSIPAWSKVHRENGPEVSDLVGQIEREQFPTDALESGAATLQLYSDPPGKHEQWECGHTFPSWQAVATNQFVAGGWSVMELERASLSMRETS